MCGGIVAALTAGLPRDAKRRARRQLPYQLGYNLGRIVGYALAGALMGGLGLVLAQHLPIENGQRFLYGVSGIGMILLGLYLADWWRGLEWLERAGAKLWRRIEPFGRRLFPVASPYEAFALGLVWAWLPCGLVYSVLIWSVASGSPVQGALLLFLFGLGTLPNLLAMGFLAGGVARYAGRPLVRRAAGALIIGFGLHALTQLWLL